MVCPECGSKTYKVHMNKNTGVERKYCLKCGYGLNPVSKRTAHSWGYITG